MDTFTLESRCWVQWFSKWVPGSEHQHHLRISWNENYTELEILGVGSRILCYKLSWCLCSMLKFENHLLWQHNEPTPLRGELNSEDEIASCTFSVTHFRALKEFFSRTNNFTCSTNSVLLHWGKMKSYGFGALEKNVGGEIHFCICFPHHAQESCFSKEKQIFLQPPPNDPFQDSWLLRNPMESFPGTVRPQLLFNLLLRLNNPSSFYLYLILFKNSSSLSSYGVKYDLVWLFT